MEGALKLASKETVAEDGRGVGQDAALCTRGWFVEDGFEGRRIGEGVSVVDDYRASMRGTMFRLAREETLGEVALGVDAEDRAILNVWLGQWL